MHTITLKSDDVFFEMLSDLSKTLNTSRSELIRKAVISYKEVLEKEQLKEQIKRVSLKTRTTSLYVAQMFEESLEDGLIDV